MGGFVDAPDSSSGSKVLLQSQPEAPAEPSDWKRRRAQRRSKKKKTSQALPTSSLWSASLDLREARRYYEDYAADAVGALARTHVASHLDRLFPDRFGTAPRAIRGLASALVPHALARGARCVDTRGRLSSVRNVNFVGGSKLAWILEYNNNTVQYPARCEGGVCIDDIVGMGDYD